MCHRRSTSEVAWARKDIVWRKAVQLARTRNATRPAAARAYEELTSLVFCQV